MALLIWSQSLSVEDEALDAQHRQLVEILNQLHEAAAKGERPENLRPLLEALVQYTQTHFADEERHMERHGYSGLAAHRAEHEALTRRVLSTKARYEAGEQVELIELVEFLKQWLVSHILGSDKKYARVITRQTIAKKL